MEYTGEICCMYELKVAFSEDDIEFQSVLEEQFGSDLRYIRERGFDGWEFLITVAIPVAEVSIALVEFILDHFRNHDTGKKRVIIEENGKIDLTGYSAEDAERIIRAYFESQKIAENE